MDTATVRLEATIGSCALNMSVSVPAGPATVDDFLPLLQILDDKIVASAEHEVDQQGKCISCQKGCGACCRQLVPLSPADARHIARLVANMPEPRKTEIVGRFAAARQKLEETGFLQKLDERQQWLESDVSRIGVEYFQLGIACPFLEEESCSIHRERPLTCREYLVTSPAVNCASPSSDSIDCVPLPAKVWLSAARAESKIATGERFVKWIPLIQALDWAAENLSDPMAKPGPELLRQLIEGLASTSNEPLLAASRAQSAAEKAAAV
ncbi:MAG TPA: YkgJ family cysteine cluster protein [Pirellulaceae bacterium]|jgi:Fe-S-cluster containining protein